MMQKFIIVVMAVLLTCSQSFGAWQDTLEANFDIVETFDQLQNWSGVVTYGATTGLPVKSNGDPSIWKFYTNTETAVSDWIGDHGSEYNFNGSSKSLCINYPPTDAVLSVTPIVGHGPSRLATFFGDGITGNSGYKTIHVFYMQKFRDGFFIEDASDNDGWAPYNNGYLKLIEICSGFTSVNHWGNASEYSTVCVQSSVAPRDDYGLNFSIFNIVGGGAATPYQLYYAHFPQSAGSITGCTNPSLTTTYGYIKRSPYYDRDINISTPFSNSQWIGVEIILNIGDVDQANGTQTVKLYSQTGTLLSEVSHTGIDSLRIFDHKYNKVTFGGNRSFMSALAETPEGRVYYDDIIINDTEIAPTYFALLASQGEVANLVVEILTSSGQTTTASIFTITGTATADIGQTISGVICSGQTVTPDDGTWDEQEEAFTCLANLALGENTLVFIGSDGTRTGSDSITVTRTAPSSITNTSLSHGVLRH